MIARTVEAWLVTAPKDTFEAILSVTAERSRQEDLGYTPEHDDQSSVTHVVFEAYQRLGKLGINTDAECRKGLVEVAAMLVAAVEVIDRAPGPEPERSPADRAEAAMRAEIARDEAKRGGSRGVLGLKLMTERGTAGRSINWMREEFAARPNADVDELIEAFAERCEREEAERPRYYTRRHLVRMIEVVGRALAEPRTEEIALPEREGPPFDWRCARRPWWRTLSANMGHRLGRAVDGFAFCRDCGARP